MLYDDNVNADIKESHNSSGQDDGDKVEKHEKVVVHDWYEEALVTSEVAIIPAKQR